MSYHLLNTYYVQGTMPGTLHYYLIWEIILALLQVNHTYIHIFFIYLLNSYFLHVHYVRNMVPCGTHTMRNKVESSVSQDFSVSELL